MITRIVLAVYEPWQPSPFLFNDTCQGRYIVNSVLSLLEYKLHVMNRIMVFPSLYSLRGNHYPKMGLIRMYETPEGYFMAFPCEYILTRFQRLWKRRYQQRIVEIRSLWTPKAILARQMGRKFVHQKIKK